MSIDKRASPFIIERLKLKLQALRTYHAAMDGSSEEESETRAQIAMLRETIDALLDERDDDDIRRTDLEWARVALKDAETKIRELKERPARSVLQEIDDVTAGAEIAMLREELQAARTRFIASTMECAKRAAELANVNRAREQALERLAQANQNGRKLLARARHLCRGEKGDLQQLAEFELAFDD